MPLWNTAERPVGVLAVFPQGDDRYVSYCATTMLGDNARRKLKKSKAVVKAVLVIDFAP